MDIAYENNLFRACSILFGSEISVCREFLSYLQPSGVKTAFRKQALVTHPDRVIFLDDVSKAKSTDLFIQTTWAYKQLLDFIRERENGTHALFFSNRADNRGPAKKHYHETNQYMRFYAGLMPQRTLLFAEYLYYSGMVPWKVFIQSIVWQRRQRPQFGEIAERWRYLSGDDINYIMTGRKLCEKIGETAVRLNLLMSAQVKVILTHQRLNQRKIGEYFVENGYLTREKIDSVITDFKKHNARFYIRKVH